MAVTMSQDTMRLLLSVQGALGMLRNRGIRGEVRVTSRSFCFLTGPHREELGYSGRLQEQGGIYRDQHRHITQFRLHHYPVNDVGTESERNAPGVVMRAPSRPLLESMN